MAVELIETKTTWFLPQTIWDGLENGVEVREAGNNIEQEDHFSRGEAPEMGLKNKQEFVG
jgi:hypothetical protein